MKIISTMILMLAVTLVASDPPTYTTREYKDKYALGLVRTKKSIEFLKKSPKLSIEKNQDTLVPGKVDLSSQVSPPEDQGNCGSCWAFAITKSLRSEWMLAGKDPGTLAFNYLVNNCGPVREWGCGGGDFDAMNNMISGLGPWLESKDPYSESDGGHCLGLPPEATAKDAKVIGSGSKPPTFQELALVVAAKHVPVIDVAVCGQWGNYSGGVFNKNDCGAGSINHMINLVGYDCETSVDAQGNCKFNSAGKPVNGDGYLKVMNNWGNWGEQGYMRTRWGIDAVANDAMYFEIDAPIPPPPPPTPPPGPGPVPDGGIPKIVWIVIGILGAIVLVLGTIVFTKKSA